MALRNSRKTRRATGSCELTSILSSITGLPRTFPTQFNFIAPKELPSATTLAKPTLTYYHTSQRARRHREAGQVPKVKGNPRSKGQGEETPWHPPRPPASA